MQGSYSAQQGQFQQAVISWLALCHQKIKDLEDNYGMAYPIVKLHGGLQCQRIKTEAKYRVILPWGEACARFQTGRVLQTVYL